LYYQLEHHCKLINGASRAAIYDFKTGKVHSINAGAAGLLSACVDHPLDELWDINNPETIHYMDFLQKLTAKELGTFHNTKPTPP